MRQDEYDDQTKSRQTPFHVKLKLAYFHPDFFLENWIAIILYSFGVI